MLFRSCHHSRCRVGSRLLGEPLWIDCLALRVGWTILQASLGGRPIPAIVPLGLIDFATHAASGSDIQASRARFENSQAPA